MTRKYGISSTVRILKISFLLRDLKLYFFRRRSVVGDVRIVVKISSVHEVTVLDVKTVLLVLCKLSYNTCCLNLNIYPDILSSF